MKFVFVLVALVAAVAAETYSTENDDIDIEKVVGDPVVLKAFLDCFSDKAPCDVKSADFKKDLPDAVETACTKCTAAQKHIFKRFLETVKVNNPADYEVFKQKYDPEGKHLTALETAIANV